MTAGTRPFRLGQTPHDAAVGDAERSAVVVWRGERIAFAALPRRIAEAEERSEREGMLKAWIEGLEALNPRYEARMEAWREQIRAAGIDDTGAGMAEGRDLEALALDVERLAVASETVYYAALRRYLALVDIEQGDATVADLWHIVRGAAWGHWFGQRELDRAAAEAGRRIEAESPGSESHGPQTGGADWRAAEASLAMPIGQGEVGAALGEVYGSLVGDPAWLGGALRMGEQEIAAFADFVAFVRLWRLRRAVGLTHYELRLYGTDDPALQRAYYAGIVGNITGVEVPEAAYLADVGRPFSGMASLETTMLAGAILETLEIHHGPRWWAEDGARALVDGLAESASTNDALARLGYDALDWRPVLRQIRTRLIGEMSGYGGPNITTRAGTRKV